MPKRRSRSLAEPQPGFYRFRQVRGGPWLPAVVTIENEMIYIVEADERLKLGIAKSAYADAIVNSVMDGEAFNTALWRVLFFGEPIDEAEYRHLLKLIAWARQAQPDHPILHPDQPIKPREVKVSQIF